MKITGQIQNPAYEPRVNLKLKIERKYTRAKKNLSQISTNSFLCIKSIPDYRLKRIPWVTEGEVLARKKIPSYRNR